jgi:protein-S-isoprenylcysteine O-methyltransferase Ste14
MERLIVFGILSVPVVILSWRALFNPKSHGFYRFFGWECMLWLFASNYRFWFDDPFSVKQIFSWILLFYSIYPAVAGAIQLRKAGKPGSNRDEKALYAFEKTSELVDTGIFKYIRHPLYSSLIFLTWGIFLKNTTVPLFVVALSSTAFLWLTAIFDEKECVRYFGDTYVDYMKRSKRFVPYLI